MSARSEVCRYVVGMSGCRYVADHWQSTMHMHVRKKWRQLGMSVIMFSFLMDFSFDLYVFHFLEWS